MTTGGRKTPIPEEDPLLQQQQQQQQQQLLEQHLEAHRQHLKDPGTPWSRWIVSAEDLGTPWLGLVVSALAFNACLFLTVACLLSFVVKQHASFLARFHPVVLCMPPILDDKALLAASVRWLPGAFAATTVLFWCFGVFLYYLGWIHTTNNPHTTTCAKTTKSSAVTSSVGPADRPDQNRPSKYTLSPPPPLTPKTQPPSIFSPGTTTPTYCQQNTLQTGVRGTSETRNIPGSEDNWNGGPVL